MPWQDLLSASIIEQVLEELQIKYRNRLFNPIVTLWTFLSQVIDTDKSCANAVGRVIAHLATEGVETPSANTGGYTKAKLRLPENFLKRLFSITGENLEAITQPSDLWCGRHVKILDGSSVLMPDTLANQLLYPQHTNQAAGCGFPIAKLMVMFSLSTGADEGGPD